MFALLLLTGCFGADPAGIWLIQVAYDADAGVECDMDIDENFEDGYIPGGDAPDTDSEWTYEQDYSGSDTLMFAQIETTAAGEGVLLIGGDVIPGEGAGNEWTFSWTDSSGSQTRTEHESGYRFIEDSLSASDITVDITLDSADFLSGALTATSTEEMSWKESDEFGEGAEYVAGTSGQIPAADNGVVYDDNGDEYGQYNDFESDDCDGPECELRVATVCAGTNSFTATRTDYKEEDAYAYLAAY